MNDQFGRKITYLRISVTELCNLRCLYCMPEDGVCKKRHEDMLNEDEIIRAVEAAASLGITKLRFTGASLWSSGILFPSAAEQRQSRGSGRYA